MSEPAGGAEPAAQVEHSEAAAEAGESTLELAEIVELAGTPAAVAAVVGSAYSAFDPPAGPLAMECVADHDNYQRCSCEWMLWSSKSWWLCGVLR